MTQKEQQQTYIFKIFGGLLNS